MSKYKIKFTINRADDMLDLVKDYGYSEEEAEEILQDEEELERLLEEWISDNLDAGYRIIEEE